MLYTCIYYLINNKMWSQTINQNVGRQNLYTIIQKSLISPVDQFGKMRHFSFEVSKVCQLPTHKSLLWYRRALRSAFCVEGQTGSCIFNRAFLLSMFSVVYFLHLDGVVI